jgi:hypothetical protein
MAANLKSRFQQFSSFIYFIILLLLMTMLGSTKIKVLSLNDASVVSDL